MKVTKEIGLRFVRDSDFGLSVYADANYAAGADYQRLITGVQMTSSRVRLGQSFKTVGYGCTSCWGDVGLDM